MGREFRRRLEQAGQHRGFGEVHVARGLVEVILRRRVDAERAAAHIGAVEIELEDLVLGQPRLEPDRQERFLDLALDGALVGQEQVLGELLRDRRAALHHAAGARIRRQRAHEARRIDAEVLVEAAVFGRERRLDQMVGIFVQRDRVVVADAARADLVAEAVEEGDGEFRLLQPVVVGGLAEGRDRERQHHDQAAEAERRAFRQRLDDGPAAPAGDVEAVHEGGEALVVLAQPARRMEDRRIQTRVEVKQEALELRLPSRWNDLAHSWSGRFVGAHAPALGAIETSCLMLRQNPRFAPALSAASFSKPWGTCGCSIRAGAINQMVWPAILMIALTPPSSFYGSRCPLAWRGRHRTPRRALSRSPWKPPDFMTAPPKPVSGRGISSGKPRRWKRCPAPNGKACAMAARPCPESSRTRIPARSISPTALQTEP